MFFVKYPTAGLTKTRLGETIGNEHACKLYRCFVDDLLNMLREVDAEVIVCFDPLMQSDRYRHWLGEDFRYLEQKGNDIGERMSNSLQWAFNAGYLQAIVIGSDSPDLPPYHIEKAFTKLDENDAVIGPSSDGGYYLIGFKAGSFAPEVFEGISWSSGGEFDEAMNVFLEKYDFTANVLDMWHDVDVAADLTELLARNKQTKFRNTLTYEYVFDIVNRHA